MRIALGIEYDGTDFFGWQRLTEGPSVQGRLEQALSKVAAHPVEVCCAGRTDAGVHGRCQVVHFDTEARREMHGWVLGCGRSRCWTVFTRGFPRAVGATAITS
jgi:tRNA pseudouridine38-40 synthase